MKDARNELKDARNELKDVRNEMKLQAEVLSAMQSQKLEQDERHLATLQEMHEQRVAMAALHATNMNTMIASQAIDTKSVNDKLACLNAPGKMEDISADLQAEIDECHEDWRGKAV